MSILARGALRYGVIACAVVAAIVTTVFVFPWNVSRGPLATYASARKRLIVFRRQRAALAEGAYEPICTEGQLLAFARVHSGDRLFVTANLRAEPISIPATILPPSAIVLMSTHLDRTGPIAPPVLRPNEGALFGTRDPSSASGRLQDCK